MSFVGNHVGERRGVNAHNSMRVKAQDYGCGLGVLSSISTNARFLEEEGTVTESSHLEKTASAFIVCH